jgi:DNA-binding MarR family transcriptional regulator
VIINSIKQMPAASESSVQCEESRIDRESVERLAEIILHLQRCLMLKLSEELSRGQVSFPQYFLLGHLNGADQFSMTEIAETMNHTTAAATGLVDRLENLGYVARMHATEDRRKVLVRITPKGEELVDCIRQDIVEGLTKLTDYLTPEEGRMWLQIYDKIFNYCQSQPSDCKK